MDKTKLMLAASWLGTIAAWATEAKSILGALAALCSLIASIYAIANSHQRLKAGSHNPFSAPARASRTRSTRPLSRSDRSSRLKKTRKLVAHCVLIIAVVALTGCSHVATTRARSDRALTQSNEQLAEHSRALTTGIVDTLAALPNNSVLSPQSSELRLAKRLAAADQEIEGLPLQRIPATAALAGNAKAAEDIEDRFTEINSIRAHNKQLAQALRERDAALMELGAQYEAEKNKSIWRRIKASLFSTLGLGGLIALCIFCPAVIPILTRAVAWLVAKVPQLAGALGVVGKDAFDAVVKGVGQTRDFLKTVKSQDLKILDTNLRTETDQSHKNLIAQRRAALNV